MTAKIAPVIASGVIVTLRAGGGKPRTACAIAITAVSTSGGSIAE